MKKILYPAIVMISVLSFAFLGCSATQPVQQAASSEVTASSGVPEWYLSGSLPGFGVETYIIGIGEALNLDDAIAQAQAMIGGQLKVSVESTVESFRKETNIGGELDFFETFSESSSITVSETLKGSRIIEQQMVDGTYYVFAALHIQSYISQLLLDLDELGKQTANQLAEARSAIGQGLVFVAMEHYRNAYDFIVQYYTKRSYLEAIAPHKVPRGTIGASEIVSEIRSMLGSLQLIVLAGDNQNAPLGTTLEHPIDFQVLYQSRTGDHIPVARIPVTLRAEDKSSIGRKATDARGIASFMIQAVPVQPGKGSVMATIDMYAIMGEFASSVGRPEAIARYTIAEPPQRQHLEIELLDTVGNRMESLERTVGRDLEDLGFSVSPGESEWILQGTCFVASQQELSSYQGTQFVVSVELELKMVHKKSGNSSASRVIIGSGMSTKDFVDATRIACARVRIDKKDISALVAGMVY